MAQRAAAYARYSTDLQQESSITAQLRAITEYCLQNDMDVVASYIDEAKSGTNTSRSGFSDLVSAAESKKFDAVVIYDISRGSRDVVDWFAFRKQMRSLGVQVFSATEKLGDISDPNAFLTELITVGLGQHQVLQSRQKSIAGKKVRAEKGLFCGGIPPLGYDIKGGNYIINELEAQAVRLIFDMYAKGRSYSEIMENVNTLGVVGKRGQKIGKNTLHFILKNDRYTGRFTWFKKTMRDMHKWVGRENEEYVTVEGAVPQIVDDTTWRRVKERMESNKHNMMNKGKRKYLLSGLLRCAKCGGAFVGITTTSKGREYKRYRCGNRWRLHNCDCKDIHGDEIETLLVSVLKRDLLYEGLIEATVDAIFEAVKDHVGDSAADIKKEIASIDQKNANLMRLAEQGDLPLCVRDRMAENEARKKILTEHLADAPVLSLPSREKLINEMSIDAQRIKDDPGCTREMLKKYIVWVDLGDEEIIVHAIADTMLYQHPFEVIDGGLHPRTIAKKEQNKRLATANSSCKHDWLPR